MTTLVMHVFGKCVNHLSRFRTPCIICKSCIDNALSNFMLDLDRTILWKGQSKDFLCFLHDHFVGTEL
jgi:hypothetical protein